MIEPMTNRSHNHVRLFSAASTKTIVWLTLAAVSVVVAVWVAFPRKTVTSAAATRAVYQMPKEERIAICESVPVVPISSDAKTDQPVRQALDDAIRDPHKILTDVMRSRLLDTLAGHILARAQEDSASYLRLADSEHTRWLPEEDERRWRIIIARFQAITHQAPKRTDPRGTLAQVMNYSLAEEKTRIVGLGSGPHGAVICVDRVRSSERIVDNLLSDPKDTAYWFFTGSTGSAIAFRVPERSFEEVVSRDGSGVFVQAALLIRIERGRPILLNTRWYWDPVLGVWQCAAFQTKGPYLYATEF